jgi:hypothetical protein
MKKILQGLILLGSFSSFADTTYKCNSDEGVITVIEKEGNEVSVNFGSHSVKELDYFSTSYFDLLKKPNRDIIDDETLPQYEGHNAIVNISEKNLEDGVNGFLDQRKFVNNNKKLIVNSSGSQDFSSFDVEFSLNKSKLTARVKYSVSVWYQTYGKMNDKLKCEKH